MKRRDFILTGTAGIAAIGIPGYYYFSPAEYAPALARPTSLSMICEMREITQIGNAFRSMTPDEKRANTLVGLLTEGTDPKGKTPESLEGRIKNDFQTGRTVIVDGWILSVTEARQCALFSTAQPK